MNGIALTVLVTQLPKIFDIKIESAGPLRNLWRLGAALSDGKANWITFAIGGGTLVLILSAQALSAHPDAVDRGGGGDRGRRRFQHGRNCGVKVLGPLPRACRLSRFPWIGMSTWSDALAGWPSRWFRSPTPASSRALMRAKLKSTSIRIRRWWAWARRTSPRVLPGFPISSSSSRTPVAESAGREDADDRRRPAPSRSRCLLLLAPEPAAEPAPARWRRW
jgi:hypothetical protein